MTPGVRRTMFTFNQNLTGRSHSQTFDLDDNKSVSRLNEDRQRQREELVATDVNVDSAPPNY